MKQIEISIVIPVYNEEDNLEKLNERLTAVLKKMKRSNEIIYVNDGSKDKSAELLAILHKQKPKQIRVINFHGNFGQHMAVMAGFKHSRGNIVVTLDADLQNPPEEIPKLIELMDQGHDLVSGLRKSRRDNWFRRNVSKMVNLVRAAITNINMTDHGCMLRAYARHVVDLMVESKEANTFIPALAYSYASYPAEIAVEHEERAEGKSKYRLYDLIRLNFDLMTGFSIVPLQIFTLIGVFVSMFSLVFVVYMFMRRIIVGPEAEGVFTLLAIMFFLVGILLMGVGIMGEYIGRIYQQVRQRPRYAIREILESDTEETQ